MIPVRVYLERNWRRILPLGVCAFLALSTLLFLDMIASTLSESKEQYIEVYEGVTVLSAIDDSTEPIEGIAVIERSLQAKLSFGTARLPLFELGLEDADSFLRLARIPYEVPPPGSMLIHAGALKAAEAAGLPDHVRELTPVLFTRGPRVAVVVVEEVGEGTYVVPASAEPVPRGYSQRTLQSELESLDGEGRFLRAISRVLLSVAVLALGVALTAMTLSMLRSRQRELAILAILGHRRGDILRFSLICSALPVLIGSLSGALTGWFLGYLLAVVLTPGGVRFFWPQELVLHVATPVLLLAVSLLASYRVVSSIDPVTVVERANR